MRWLVSWSKHRIDKEDFGSELDSDLENAIEKHNESHRIKYGHGIRTIQTGFYVSIIAFGLILVAFPVFTHDSSLSFRCSKSPWNVHEFTDECWKHLVNVSVPLGMYDITCITINCLFIVMVTSHMMLSWVRKLPFVRFLLLLMAIVALFANTGILEAILTPHYSTRDQPDLSQEVRHQLKKSLHDYRDRSYPETKAVWDTTMKEACCCGVDGFWDFLDLGQDVPESCSCLGSFSKPSCYVTSIHCDLDQEYNVTSRGCFKHVMEKIEEWEGSVIVVKDVTYLSISLIQFSLVILQSYLEDVSLI